MRAVTDTGGHVIAVPEPAAVPEALGKAVAQTRADGVIAFSERVVHMAQQAAWEAGLPANPPDVLKTLQDKELQRKALWAGGLTTPRAWALHTAEDVERALRTVNFPAVLKPAVGMGSLAVFRVAEAHQLHQAWQQARRLVDADIRISHHAPVLLLEEELIGDPEAAHDGLGDYLSVEALVVDGDPHVLAVSDKLPLSLPFRENGHVLPALRSDDECAAAIAVSDQAHRALGITFGVTHTELKLTRTGPVVIEVNGRVGGSVPEQLSLAADYDLLLNLARLSVGKRPDVQVECHRWAAYLTPQPPEGRHIVDVAPTFAKLSAIAGVESIHHVVRRETVVDSADGTASNLVRVVAAVDSPSQIFDLAAQLGEPQSFKTRPADRLGGTMPDPRSTARVFIGEPSSIDPCNGFEHDGALLLRFLADPLVDFDPASGAPRAAAAERWQVSADGTQVDFQLRPNVRFHHGREVTAEDYVYSLSRLVRPETGSKLAYHLAMVQGFQDVREGRSDVLSGVIATSPSRLRILLTEPFYEIANVFGHRATAAVPRELAEGDPEEFRAQPVSTGPYRVAEPWRPGVGLVLERSEVYYGANEAFADGGAGHLNRLDFRIYDELEDAYRDWHAGELDVVKVPPARIPDALALGSRFRRTPCALMQYLGFPTTVPPFDNPAVVAQSLWLWIGSP